MTKYFGRWTSWQEMKASFTLHYNDLILDMADPDQIICAAYGGGAYEGDAFVLFERDGKLFEVNGSHCSCFGLEGQWEPEETTWAALAARTGLLAKDKRYYSETAFDEISQEMRDYLKARSEGNAAATAKSKCSCGSCQR